MQVALCCVILSFGPTTGPVLTTSAGSPVEEGLSPGFGIAEVTLQSLGEHRLVGVGVFGQQQTQADPVGTPGAAAAMLVIFRLLEELFDLLVPCLRFEVLSAVQRGRFTKQLTCRDAG
jgi:hypothetical protein